ncbi:hypothetical protein CLV88_1251 [Shimia abyssi]|uniref:Uncharacterized protein n=1 Tax=Shimia abyssi TaxID=1662395 RepID=A0A2P8F0W3_9RHOB|nr:hypothetical protein CLV88_1251 [Shimia abyssi]
MTYEPSTGAIEVVANDRESRAELAQFLARHLLGVELNSEKVPTRQYDLPVLLNLSALIVLESLRSFSNSHEIEMLPFVFKKCLCFGSSY